MACAAKFAPGYRRQRAAALPMITACVRPWRLLQHSFAKVGSCRPLLYACFDPGGSHKASASYPNWDKPIGRGSPGPRRQQNPQWPSDPYGPIVAYTLLKRERKHPRHRRTCSSDSPPNWLALLIAAGRKTGTNRSCQAFWLIIVGHRHASGRPSSPRDNLSQQHAAAPGQSLTFLLRRFHRVTAGIFEVGFPLAGTLLQAVTCPAESYAGTDRSHC